MGIEFRKAERKKAKLRLALIAPSGFGKTYSALRIAKGLGEKTAVLDTEAGSADLYANDFDYDVLTMNAPFDAKKYIMAIKAAEEAGYGTLIIDSLSHVWAGTGGLLDKQGAIADKGGNSFAAWRFVTPDYTALVDAILQSKMHIIVTLRAKTDYAIEAGKVLKLGLAPVIRENFEFEMGVVFDLDKNHNGHPSKDRTGLFDAKIVPMNEEVGTTLKTWLEYGNQPSAETVPTVHPVGSDAPAGALQETHK